MPYPQDQNQNQPPARRQERRYPPTPYRPHSAATAAYRTAYDLGVKHLGTISGPSVLRYEAGLRPGSPEQRGYRDGVTAAWVRLQKLEKFGREQARRDALELREEQRRAAHDEPPY
ncbi:hypothetical protein ACIA03_29255 [Nocardioides sp. NPDC051685]|uniref:hypothetical protein n=1 Tax=Nocardioides sp. NPDC051685 TaxID=3364334 RepID=UPI003795EA82